VLVWPLGQRAFCCYGVWVGVLVEFEGVSGFVVFFGLLLSALCILSVYLGPLMLFNKISITYKKNKYTKHALNFALINTFFL
jgi:hypothetical protein